METNKLSNEQIEEQIQIYLDRIETISDHISETADNSIRNVLRSQKEKYKQTLNLFYNEQNNRRIKSAMNFNSNVDVNLIGTKWSGKFSPDSKKDSILIFYPNGLLKYEDISSSWEINDGKIVISINNGFATLYGHIKDNKLIGNAINIQNQDWSFEYKLLDYEEFLKLSSYENAEDKNKITENQILNLGKKWSLKNYLLFESEKTNIEIQPNGQLKVDNNFKATWEIINGRILFKFNHNQTEYNGEILQNKIIGLAKNNKEQEWVFSGEFISEVVKPENSKIIKIKSENRGFGLMASNDETFNSFRLLDNGFYFEDKEKIILTSINGNKFEASKGEVPWEATMYNRRYEEDKEHYEIFYGRNPNGGQFLIYREKNNKFKNVFSIGVLNVINDGITFEII